MPVRGDDGIRDREVLCLPVGGEEKNEAAAETALGGEGGEDAGGKVEVEVESRMGGENG